MKAIITLSTVLLLLVGCSHGAARVCAQLQNKTEVTECKAMPTSSHEGADVASFKCGGICYGNVWTFDTDAHFKAGLEIPVSDLEALRVSNPKTRTLVIIAGAVPASEAETIRTVIQE